MAAPHTHPTRYEVREGAAWITLASPKTRNALSGPLVARLAQHLEDATADDAVRAIVLTGAGPAFCAGAALKNRGDMGDSSQNEGNPFIGILKALRDGPKPTICAVNGHAFGGGLGLVAAADIAIGVTDARFSFSEVRIGVIPAMISVVVLPVVGPRDTLRLFLTGERFGGEDAVRYNLLHRCVEADQLEASVQEEIDAIAKGGPNAIREAKTLVRTVFGSSEDEAFAYAEKKIADLFRSAEAKEGMSAFAAKRPPNWIESSD